MRAKRFTYMLATLALATPLTTFAASDEKPGFKEVDSDGNGKVTISEATSAGVPEKEAKDEDIDNDGKLSSNDWKFIDMSGDMSAGSGSS